MAGQSYQLHLFNIYITGAWIQQQSGTTKQLWSIWDRKPNKQTKNKPQLKFETKLEQCELW